MQSFVKCSKKICAICKYRMRFGTAPGNKRVTSYNYSCNYLEITGHSRIFENGKKKYDSQYCDKFEEGNAITQRAAWEETVRRNKVGKVEKFYTRDGKLHINDYYTDDGGN